MSKGQTVRINPRTRINFYRVDETLVLSREPQAVTAKTAKALVGLQYKGDNLVIVEGLSDEDKPEMESVTENGEE